jgi:hypothetical protein
MLFPDAIERLFRRRRSALVELLQAGFDRADRLGPLDHVKHPLV